MIRVKKNLHTFFNKICVKRIVGDKTVHNKILHSKCRICHKTAENFDEILRCEMSHGRQKINIEELVKNYSRDFC